jgi:hypothetical protein
MPVMREKLTKYFTGIGKGPDARIICSKLTGAGYRIKVRGLINTQANIRIRERSHRYLAVYQEKECEKYLLVVSLVLTPSNLLDSCVLKQNAAQTFGLY